MSTTEQQLHALYTAYKTAYDNQTADLKAAIDEESVNTILNNVDQLHAAYLGAVNRGLIAAGPQLEAAYAAAVSANTAISQARANYAALTQIITLTTQAVSTAQSILQT